MTVKTKGKSKCEESHLGVAVLFSIHWRSLLVSFLGVYRELRRLTLCVVHRVVALGKQDNIVEPSLGGGSQYIQAPSVLMSLLPSAAL